MVMPEKIAGEKGQAAEIEKGEKKEETKSCDRARIDQGKER